MSQVEIQKEDNLNDTNLATLRRIAGDKKSSASLEQVTIVSHEGFNLLKCSSGHIIVSDLMLEVLKQTLEVIDEIENSTEETWDLTKEGENRLVNYAKFIGAWWDEEKIKEALFSCIQGKTFVIGELQSKKLSIEFSFKDNVSAESTASDFVQIINLYSALKALLTSPTELHHHIEFDKGLGGVLLRELPEMISNHLIQNRKYILSEANIENVMKEWLKYSQSWNRKIEVGNRQDDTWYCINANLQFSIPLDSSAAIFAIGNYPELLKIKHGKVYLTSSEDMVTDRCIGNSNMIYIAFLGCAVRKSASGKSLNLITIASRNVKGRFEAKIWADKISPGPLFEYLTKEIKCPLFTDSQARNFMDRCK